jgi:hypothetical protein
MAFLIAREASEVVNPAEASFEMPDMVGEFELTA